MSNESTLGIGYLQAVSERGWVPGHGDMTPLPALKGRVGYISVYNRKTKTFGEFVHVGPFAPFFPTFEECRAEMIAARSQALEEGNANCRQIAQAIEHLKTIPIAAFPNVLPEVSEPQEDQAEKEEEVTKKQSLKTEADLRRPRRRANA
jgi:hypothetical protein